MQLEGIGILFYNYYRKRKGIEGTFAVKGSLRPSGAVEDCLTNSSTSCQTRGRRRGIFLLLSCEKYSKKPSLFPAFFRPCLKFMLITGTTMSANLSSFPKCSLVTGRWDGKRGGWKYSRLRHGWLANLGRGTANFQLDERGLSSPSFSPPPSLLRRSVNNDFASHQQRAQIRTRKNWEDFKFL